MRTDDFDFDLPSERIALRPMVPREAARLLVIARHRGIVAEATIGDLPHFLRAGDTLVVNDTRVIPAAFQALRRRGGQQIHVSLNLHRRAGTGAWWVFAKPGKRLHVGDEIVFGALQDGLHLQAKVDAKSESGEILLTFALEGTDLDRALARLGEMPLPPYIAAKRRPDAQDAIDYQTIYAARDGSVAAPTAGLHLTANLLARLSAQGIDHQRVTLHVGAGTFLPVKAEQIDQHVMHAEWGDVDAATVTALEQTRARGGRVIAIGTTSARLLESAARASGQLQPFSGETDIFITPGYKFSLVDGLLTNFHLPRSTLFMLVCAFAGYEVMREAYRHAIQNDYRFFSYGDACLLLPEDVQN